LNRALLSRATHERMPAGSFTLPVRLLCYPQDG